MLHNKSTIRSRRLLAYQDADGHRPFVEWIKGLNDPVTSARIHARLARVEDGLFGDAKSIGDGVLELRLAFGPGYRIYFGLDGDDVVLLLCGGDKGSQRRDIRNAKRFWTDYRRRR